MKALSSLTNKAMGRTSCRALPRMTLNKMPSIGRLAVRPISRSVASTPQRMSMTPARQHMRPRVQATVRLNLSAVHKPTNFTRKFSATKQTRCSEAGVLSIKLKGAVHSNADEKTTIQKNNEFWQKTFPGIDKPKSVELFEEYGSVAHTTHTITKYGMIGLYSAAFSLVTSPYEFLTVDLAVQPGAGARTVALLTTATAGYTIYKLAGPLNNKAWEVATPLLAGFVGGKGPRLDLERSVSWEEPQWYKEGQAPFDQTIREKYVKPVEPENHHHH